MTTKIAKRKQKTDHNGCPVGKKKSKTNDTLDDQHEEDGEYEAEPPPPPPPALDEEKAVEEETNGAADGMEPLNGHYEPQEMEGSNYVQNFRQNLMSGAVAMDAIRYFIQQAYKHPDLVVDFMRGGGTLKPLMVILADCEKDKVTDIADMFNIIHLLLIQSISYDESYAHFAARHARTIMNDYAPFIVKLLRERGELAQVCRAAAFRILKAIMLVDSGTHGRNILKLMDVCMGELDMHACRETLVKKDSGEKESLRTVFIEFNLAFLIDTSPELVRLWLSRSHMFAALVQNLVYDLAENVVLVMKSLRKYVLDCADIGKFIYRTVFNLDILKALVNVYEWVGPDKGVVSEGRKKSVLKATEEVVLPLLTSKRYFMVPTSIDLERASPRFKHLLLALKNSQLHEHQQRLVLRMFEVCPEVLPAVLENYGALLKMKKPAHRKLLLDILQLHNPEEIVAKLEPGVVSAKALSNFIVKSTLPRTALEYIGLAIAAKKEDIPFCLEILAVMIERCEKYLLLAEKARTVDQFGMKKLKFDAINQILGLFPSVDRIIAAMERHRDDRGTQKTNVAMEHAMDILLVCIRSFRAYVESSSFITTFKSILQPAYRTASHEMYYLNYEFKAIKVVIALEPQSVSFGSPEFPSVLKLVTKVYLNADAAMRQEATEMLLDLFRNTALFGNSATEIEFWFQALYDVEPALVPELVAFLAQSARQATEHMSKRSAAPAGVTLLNKAFETVGARAENLDELFARIEQEEERRAESTGELPQAPAEANDVQLELPVTDNFFLYMFPGAVKQHPKYRRYLAGVALRYLHHLPFPEIVEKALAESPEGKDPSYGSLLKYAREWMAGKECALGSADNGWGGLLSVLSKALVSKDKTVALFTDEKDKNARSQLSHMLHQTVFHLSRLITARTLTQQHMEVISHYTHQLLSEILQQRDTGNLSERDLAEVMAALFLQRPILFEHFTIIEQQQQQQDLEASEPLATICRLVSDFVYELMQKLHHLPNFDRYTTLYSNKILSELIRASRKEHVLAGKPPPNSALVEKLLGIFKFNERQCVTLLRHYAQLPAEAFIASASAGNQRTFHYKQLCFALEKLTGGPGESRQMEHFLTEQTFRGLMRIYMECSRLVASDPAGLEELERALLGYLGTFTHSIAHVDAPGLMRVFFENRQRLGKPLVKLATFLFARLSRFDAPFLELVGQHMSNKKELVYPLLNVAFARSVFSPATGDEADKASRQTLLNRLYGEFKGGIVKMIEKPHKAAVIYRENTLANESLVRLCMPRNECVDFARKKLRIESVEVFQLRVLMTIYGNALEALKEDGPQQTIVYGNVFAVLLQCFEVLFRSAPSAEAFLARPDALLCLNELVLALYGWSKQVKRHKALQEMSFEGILASANWNTFCKTCLKLGIAMPPCAVNARRYDERLYVLPQIMAIMVDLLYANDVSEQQDIGRYYDWALSHSAFLRVFLTQINYKPKTALLHLLYVLAKKNTTVADSKHVPLLLGAYGATLSDSNRYILALLQLYERAGVQMHEFRPFLWGETAIKHFSLDADANAETSEQPTSRRPRHAFRTNPAEVFSLLAKEKISSTIHQFPVWRRLDACAQLPASNFDDLQSEATNADRGSAFGYQPASEVERFVERPRRKFDKQPPQQLLAMRSLKPAAYGQMYDPAFLVPMLEYLFSPENADMLVPAGRLGLLALPFVCLASSDEEMRLAAGSVIMRIRGHLELTRRFIDAEFWLHLFSSVQKGLGVMKEQAIKRKQRQTLPRAPFISTIFIAETINLLPEVLNELHRPMTRYIMQAETFDFRAIPNFMLLFNSSDVKHAVHRTFMLETIYRGIQTHEDFAILRASPVLRVMMHFHGSPLSNRDLNITILNALNTLAKLPMSCEVLVNSLGFLPWLNQRIDALESFEFDNIEAFLGILSNCWYSMELMAITNGASQARRQQRQQHQPMRLPVSFHRSVLIAALKFLPLLSTRSSSKTLIRFLNLLEKTTSTRYSNVRLLGMVSEQVLGQMMEYFEKLFGAHLWCVRYVRQCGTHGCDDDGTLGRKLRDAGTDQNTITIVLSLRRFVMRWQSFQKAGGASGNSTDFATEEEPTEVVNGEEDDEAGKDDHQNE